jgi:hypothetical protein
MDATYFKVWNSAFTGTYAPEEEDQTYHVVPSFSQGPILLVGGVAPWDTIETESTAVTTLRRETIASMNCWGVPEKFDGSGEAVMVIGTIVDMGVLSCN